MKTMHRAIVQHVQEYNSWRTKEEYPDIKAGAFRFDFIYVS